MKTSSIQRPRPSIEIPFDNRHGSTIRLGHEIEEPSADRQVCDVGAPYGARPIYLEIKQHIRVDLVPVGPISMR